MKIVVLDGYALNPGDLSWEAFESLGEVKLYPRTEEKDILTRCLGAEVVITNKTPLKKETLEQLPELRYIGVLATGYDVVDIGYAAERNIPVTNIPSYGSESVAQMVFALILEFTNQVALHSLSVKEGEWTKSKDFCYFKTPLLELSNKTMGIIGLGAIGEKVARIALGFNMKVIAFSRRRNIAFPGEKNFSYGNLEDVFSQSDFISLNVPLTEFTKGIINKDSIALMKPGAYLINTSRGKLIEEQHLAEALNSGAIAGAALDVLSVEPPTEDNPLLKAKNCIITPHIAWGTHEARSRLMDTAYNNLKAFLEGEPINVVNY